MPTAFLCPLFEIVSAFFPTNHSLYLICLPFTTMNEGALHREWSIWNQLILGSNASVGAINSITQVPVTESGAQTTSNAGSKEKSNYYDEKQDFAEIPQYKPYNFDEEKQTVVSNSRSRKLFILKYVCAFIFTLGIFSCLSNKLNLKGSEYFKHSPCPMQLKNQVETTDSVTMHNLDEQFAGHFDTMADEEAHEIIDIPFLPHSNISHPSYSQILVNHTFGASWNKPYSVDYAPPPSNITYNKVILTLETTIQGVQYDRLLHIYLNNNELWRSSTIEPAGKLSHSFTQKDVTMYSKLFEEPGHLLVQLDNLLTSKLTGEFEVIILALYFNDPDVYHPSSRPSIVALTPSKINDDVPPIIYYPDSPLRNIALPTVQYNTTQLLLLVTSSANADEEFWYSNLVDQYKNNFISHKRHFNGHGSCRVINVYVNGIRVHSSNPKPYIFTGGIAPTLWDPIVSTGAFDIMPYHIDLTPILPLLWSDSNAVLDIEVTNCIDDDTKTVLKSGIGSNWITSASLAIWEDATIDDSYGEVSFFDNSTAVKSFAIAPPFSGMLTQIIKASYSNHLKSNITYLYNDGTESNELSTFENVANQTSMIIITKFGDTQKVLSIPNSEYSRTITDGTANELIIDTSMSSNITLASKLEFEPPIIGSNDVTYNVNLSLTYETGRFIGKTPLFEITSNENGTAQFTISPTGNHGTGSMLHNYTFSNIYGDVYSRVALADNRTIVYDNVTFTELEEGESISNSIFSVPAVTSDIDWLSPEEFSEIEKFLGTEETSLLVEMLLSPDIF